jgi:predicted DNA-binding protein
MSRYPKESAEMVRINTRISKEVNDWLDNKSAKTGISKSALVYLALEQYIQQQKVADDMPKMMEILTELKRLKMIPN